MRRIIGFIMLAIIVGLITFGGPPHMVFFGMFFLIVFGAIAAACTTKTENFHTTHCASRVVWNKDHRRR